jgi:hypothetical protein
MDYQFSDPFKIHSNWRETLWNVDFKGMAPQRLLSVAATRKNNR